MNQNHEQVGMIYKTFDYDFFKRPFNRELDQRNVKAIIENVEENGQAITPIKLTQNNEVADGQHRLEAFKRLGLPIYYFIDTTKEELKPEHLISENNVGIKWKSQDYLKMKVKQGDDNYVKLSNAIDSTNLPYFIAFFMLKLNTARREKFLKGLYVYEPEHFEDLKYYDYILTLIDYKVPDSTLRAMFAVIHKCRYLNGFNLDRLIKLINENPAIILGLGRQHNIASAFDKIYNKGLAKAKRINFLEVIKTRVEKSI